MNIAVYNNQKFMSLYNGLSMTMMVHMPLMSADRLSGVLRYLDLQQVGQSHTVTTPSWEDMAFVYAMLAGIYKKDGNQVLANQLFELCRQLITTNDFERVTNSFVGACCFQSLGVYCILEEDEPRAEYFLNNVNSYLENQKDKTKHPCHTLLLHSQNVIAGFLSKDALLRSADQLNKIFVDFLCKFVYLEKLYQSDYGRFISHNLPLTNIFANMNLSVTVEDVCERVSDIYRGRELVQHINKVFLDTMDQIMQRFPHPSFLYYKLTSVFSFKTYELVYNVIVGDDLNARIVADGIAKTLSSTDFSNCFMIIADVINVTSDYHIKCIENCSDPMDKLTLLQYLKDEYAAVSIMNKKYLKTKLTNNKKKLEYIINKYNVDGVDGCDQQSVLYPNVKTSYNFNKTMTNFTSVIQSKLLPTVGEGIDYRQDVSLPRQIQNQPQTSNGDLQQNSCQDDFLLEPLQEVGEMFETLEDVFINF
ncbi:nudix hydrolase NudL [Acrasis kona]|uniref:Nudix hydrolase NudL n=1 Tax=Acrasis kona TaxID=1008807 RepID=A0AAW2ZM47_9EUKA